MRTGIVCAAAVLVASTAPVSAGDFVVDQHARGRPVVASAPGGEFLVAWTYFGVAAGRGYGADGVALGPPFGTLPPAGPPFCSDFFQPAVARYPDGSYVVAALRIDDASPGCVVPDGPILGGICSILFQRLSLDGSPLGPPTSIFGSPFPCSIDGPGVATQVDGSLVLVYHDNGSGAIQGVRYPAANLPAQLGSGYNPAVAAGPAGEVAVTWLSLAPPNSVVLRLFALDGTPLGPEQVVNEIGQGADPAVAYGTGGKVFVVWTGPGPGNDNSGGAVQGRFMDANGTPLGPQFQVNTLTAGDQSHARVSALPDGGFLVAWESQASAGADQEGYSIQVRHYLPDGTPDGPEQQVNAFASGDQSLPDIAAAAPGRPAIVWNNNDDEVRAFNDRVDLGITISDGTTTTTPGATLTYVAAVTNPGGVDVGGAPVSVVFPGVLACTWTCSGSGGASCAGGTQAGDVVDVASVPVGGTATYQATCVVGQQAAGTLVVSASVSAPPGDTDVNPANDSASDSTDVQGIVVDDFSLLEGNLGTQLTYVTVRLLSPAAGTVTVDASVGGGTATPGVDYQVSTPVTLTFDPGESDAILPFTVFGDTTFEVDETFLVTVSNPNGAPIVDGQAVVTLVNDDSGLPSGSLDELVHGSSEVRSLESAPGPAPVAQYWRLSQVPVSSYEVVVDGASGDLGPQGPSLQRLASDGTVLQQASGTGSSRSLRWETTNVPGTNQRIRVQSNGCIDDCDAADVFRIRMWETTGFLSRFNNSATQVTVVLLQNPGTDSVGGLLGFYDASGSLIAFLQPFYLAPRGTLALNSSTLPGLSQASGSIRVATDAHYGTLQGKAVAVEPATGFTFDTPLAPRPR